MENFCKVGPVFAINEHAVITKEQVIKNVRIDHVRYTYYNSSLNLPCLTRHITTVDAFVDHPSNTINYHFVNDERYKNIPTDRFVKLIRDYTYPIVIDSRNTFITLKKNTRIILVQRKSSDMHARLGIKKYKSNEDYLW